MNHFGSWISEKMLWTSGIEWSSDISKLDESDFKRYGCNPNECMMLGELKKFVMDYVEKHPTTRKPAPAKVPPPDDRDSVHRDYFHKYNPRPDNTVLSLQLAQLKLLGSCSR